MKVTPNVAGNRSLQVSLWRAVRQGPYFLAFSWLAVAAPILAAANSTVSAEQVARVTYTNVVVAAKPWSIHVVKIPRAGSLYEIHARHAGAGALGMSPLVEQIAGLDPALGNPVAAINGGFYQREKIYAGSARGLQIVGSEVLSAPAGTACLWIDVGGGPHLEKVTSQFQITWPDGRSTPFGLNEERPDNGIVLYSPAIGTSTHTVGGLEFVLERGESSRWLPLRMGRNLSARVRAVQRAGDTALSSDIMVLSVGPKIMERFQPADVGAVLQISTASSPNLSVARTALSAGPVLVQKGKRQKNRASVDDAYESSSMLERHPRSAIGWNAECYFLVQVDGRQRDLSDGMTLDELTVFLVKLGCEEALNLDGGGSSTLWFGGNVRNSPCDGYERAIANSLVVVRKETKTAAKRIVTQNQAAPAERDSQQ